MQGSSLAENTLRRRDFGFEYNYPSYCWGIYQETTQEIGSSYTGSSPSQR